MSKILTIAVNEFRTVVFTKSFLFALILPPVIYGAMFLMMFFVRGTTDLEPRTVIIVDQSGYLVAAFQAAARDYNRSDVVYNQEGRQVGPEIVIESFEDFQLPMAELELQLSDRVRAGEAFAFAIIGEGFVPIEGRENDFLRYYSRSPTEHEIPRWIQSTARETVEGLRLEQEGLDPGRVRQIFNHSSLERFNLAEQRADGEVSRPKAESFELSFFAPMIAVLMLFFSIMQASPILLNSVIEEKMQRIAEVLLSSVTATQLLWGKLIAGAGVGLSFSAVYVVTGAFALGQLGRLDYLSGSFFVFLFLFLIVSLLTFGSMMAGISASCQDIKDSQNMAGMVVLLAVLPMMFSVGLIFAPQSALAQALSFIPPFSPMVMTVRLAIPPGPDLWQPLLALAINLLFAVFVVLGAARIFRIGILAQGKTPTWRELLRWAFRG